MKNKGEEQQERGPVFSRLETFATGLACKCCVQERLRAAEGKGADCEADAGKTGRLKRKTAAG